MTVYRWTCTGCNTSFLMYIDSDPEACPNCGRQEYGDTDFNKISDLEVQEL